MDEGREYAKVFSVLSVWFMDRAFVYSHMSVIWSVGHAF